MEVIIGKSGVPVARLVPYKKKAGLRKPGLLKGKIIISDDFDTLPDDLFQAFRGEAN